MNWFIVSVPNSDRQREIPDQILETRRVPTRSTNALKSSPSLRSSS